MVSDMERIGDQAADIADLSLYIAKNTSAIPDTITRMAEDTVRMVTESVDAFVKKDIVLAEAVIAQDDIVDDYFSKIKNSIIELIAKNAKDGEFALDLLMISKYFERIGDHATNIAEWVIYAVTGTH